jgi:hypothetical protein
VRAAFRHCNALTIASVLPGVEGQYHESRSAARCRIARFK